MKKQNLQTLKGFRDFLPEEKRKRDYVEQSIIKTFQKFAFEPLETPTLEYASLLLNKYGEEADQLVYTFQDRGKRKVGLRYDQTVPTARILAQYQNNLPPKFRRYQIQNVFRADKPQKGRYREFKQCDADIYQSTSPLADAEILATYYTIYQDIGFQNLILDLNDRQTLFKLLSPLANNKISTLSIIQSIDKLNKLTQEEVIQELNQKGLNKKSAKQAISSIRTAQPSSNLQKIINAAQSLGVPKKSLNFQPQLARGLDYYTGMIFEGEIPEYKVGSVGGGGRYNQLIKELSGYNLPAVGFGLGFDRTVEAADQLGLLPNFQSNSQVLLTIFNPQYQPSSLKTAKKLRKNNIKTEIYPEPKDNLTDQLSLANKKSIPFVVIIGENEAKANKLTLKNMSSGKQQTLSLEQAIQKLQNA